MTRRVLQFITEIDVTKFKRPEGDYSEQVQQMYDNMWNLFDKEIIKKNPLVIARALKENRVDKILDMNDFGWTKDAEKAFYDHPYHHDLYEKIKEGSIFKWEMSTPLNVDSEGNTI